MDQHQNISVRDIVTPTGGLCASTALLPEFVLRDIETAICQMRNTVMDTSAMSGVLHFNEDTYDIVQFDTAFPDINYRVVFSLEDFISVRLTDKTVTGFTVETDITYTGEIGYEVFIDEPSDAHGILSFSAETTKSVSFPAPFPSTNYRVFFSTDDFIAVRAINKTVNGFDADVDITHTGDIGYDVFIEDTAGILTFAAETEKTVTFPNPFYCDQYRVAISVEDFIAVRVVDKTRDGFKIEVDVSYTGQIGYEVFV